MKFLIIDSCTPLHQVALCTETGVIAHETASRGELPPMVQRLVSGIGGPDKLAFVGVTVGPGSYTGIRVGTATAKGIAYAADLPLVGVCSLRGMEPEVFGRFVALMDARNGRVYAQLGVKTESGIRWEGEPEATLRSDLPDDYMLVERAPDPVSLAREALRLWRSGDYSTDGTLKLLYLKEDVVD